MNKITKKQIEAAIRTDFGLCVSLIKDKDHFYFTDAAQEQFVVDKFQSTMVYVQTINSLSLHEWVKEFEYMLNEHNKLEANR